MIFKQCAANHHVVFFCKLDQPCTSFISISDTKISDCTLHWGSTNLSIEVSKYYYWAISPQFSLHHLSTSFIHFVCRRGIHLYHCYWLRMRIDLYADYFICRLRRLLYQTSVLYLWSTEAYLEQKADSMLVFLASWIYEVEFFPYDFVISRLADFANSHHINSQTFRL